MIRVTCLFLFSLLLHTSYETMQLKGYYFLDSVENVYKYYTEPRSWDEARNICSEEGATLFYPESHKEADAVLTHAKEITNDRYVRIWIGMYANLDRVFITTDGFLSSEVYNKWATGEPNNDNNNEFCVELHSKGLSDSKCLKNRSFVCKKTVDVLKGPAGPPGIPGPRGDKGDIGSIGYPGVAGEKGDKGNPGLPGMQGLPGPIGPEGPKGVAGRKGDQGREGAPGRQGVQGQKGDRGDVGRPGLPAVPGPRGPMGAPGRQGVQGQKGDRGDVGRPGLPAVPEPIGPMGRPGFPAVPGRMTNQDRPGTGPTYGFPGTSGSPSKSNPGVCPTCLMHVSDSQTNPDGVVPQLGSNERPSAAICKFIPASTEKVPDPYWVMEEEKFPVKCDMQTNRTCLILSNDHKWISENRFPMTNVPEGQWLSKLGLNLNSFYTVTHSQLNWLKGKSMNVIQTIRLYYINTSFEDIWLQMLNDNDILFDYTSSEHTPMYFTIRNNQQYTVEVDYETWKYVDMVVIDNVKRLPVVDFYVNLKPNKESPVYISLQLRELCFD